MVNKRNVRCDDPACDVGVMYYTNLEDALAVLQQERGLRLGFLVIEPPEITELHEERQRARFSLSVLKDHYGPTCLDCGDSGKLVVDHVVPLSRKGTSDIENLQLLCRKCNIVKGLRIIDYRPFPFRREIEFCRACQEFWFTPFTPMYWCGEFVEVCARCLPDYENSEAVINPSEHYHAAYLT